MPLFNRNRPSTPAGQPAPAATGAAMSLEKFQKAAPTLVSLYKEAGASLTKRGLAGQRAAVYLVCDRSKSMRRYYQSRRGQVSHMQYLGEQVLGLSGNLDDDGVVPTIFFDNRVYPVVEIRLGSHQGRIGDEHARLGAMGGTDYACAMRSVVEHYQASPTTHPAFVVFQTDGATWDEKSVKDLLREYSKLPVFWQFIGFGPANSREFAFLRTLDTLRGREVDNAGFFAAGDDPAAMDDAELYDRLMSEYPAWLAAARAKGII